MASVIKQSIQDMLTALTDTGQFQFIAVWNNHVDRILSGDGYSYAQPAAFVELESQEVYNLLGGLTQTDYIVRIHIVHTELDAADGTLDQNLNVFDWRDAVKVKFTGLKPTNFGNLMFYNEFQDYDHNNVYHYIMEFIGGFIDTKGSPLDADSGTWVNTTPPTALDLTVEYNPEPFIKNT